VELDAITRHHEFRSSSFVCRWFSSRQPNPLHRMVGQEQFLWQAQPSSQGDSGHMRLRTSGDRHEIRQQYLPILWQNLIKKLEVEGKAAVPEVIELMDQYFLTKDDFDAILELGVGPMDEKEIKLETQTKATFTRT
jgi:hypothetical protein